jgi:hypothetical protein
VCVWVRVSFQVVNFNDIPSTLDTVYKEKSISADLNKIREYLHMPASYKQLINSTFDLCYGI